MRLGWAWWTSRASGGVLSVLLGTVIVAVASSATAAPPDAQADVQIRKGPYLTGLSDTGIEVRFELDRPAAATVDITSRTADAGGRRTLQDAAAAMHVVNVSGLSPGTEYTYTVRVGRHEAGSGTFRTAPARDSGAPLRFLVYGDDRTDTAAHAAVVRALMQTPADFLVNTGDLVTDGGRAPDWQSFFDVEAPLLRDRALFVSIGNHELYDDAAGANFVRYFGSAASSDGQGPPRPFGTYRLSNVRFFLLNSVHGWDSGEDRAWLERELAHSDSEAGVVWRIAVMHQGPWSSGPHGGSEALWSAHVPELLAAHHVDLVFAGHDHIYERGDANGTKYILSGGGGAPLYRVSHLARYARKVEASYHFVEVDTTDRAVAIAARRVDGSLIERCGFDKGAPWDCDPPPAAAVSSSPAAPSPSAAAATSGEAHRSSSCAVSATMGQAGSSIAAALLGAIAVLGASRRRSRGDPRDVETR